MPSPPSPPPSLWPSRPPRPRHGTLPAGRRTARAQAAAAGGAATGALAARLLAAALLAALVLVTTGCVGSAESSSPAAGASILGGWSIEPDVTCRESLAFRADGSVLHGVALHLPEQDAEWLAAGRYSGGSATDAAGSLPIQLTPQGATAHPLLTYCGQWTGAARTALPYAEVAADTGIDLATLTWRALTLPAGSSAWVGADAADTERFALVRDAGALHGFVLDGLLPGGQSLFQRDPTALPLTYPPDAAGYALLNLPQYAYRATFTGVDPNVLLQGLLLSVHGTADVHFESAGGLPACVVQAWDSLDFGGAQRFPDPLADATDVPYKTLYPGADPAPLLRDPPAGGAEPLYLLPVEIHSPPEGDCGLAIRARATAARIVEEYLAGALPDAFALPLGPGPAYLLGVPLGQPGTLRALPLQAGGGWPAARLVPELVQPATGAADPLGLLAGAGGALRLSVQQQGTQRFLTAFPMGGEAGLGPLTAYPPPAAAAALTLPASIPVSLSDPPRTTLHFTLAAPTVLRLETDGGVDTRGTLRDAAGTQLASAHGGAPDGAGLRIVAALEPGTHSLQIEAAAVPADFTVELDAAPDLGLADAHLAACLLGAAADAATPSTLLRADCHGRAIASLAGIGAYNGLLALRLDDNPLAGADPLAPLTALITLGDLSLAGTPPADLTPLAGLAQLYRLSLARTALDAAALAVLPALTDLTELDLRDATGLGAQALSDLKTALPDTRIVAPDGTVLE